MINKTYPRHSSSRSSHTNNNVASNTAQMVLVASIIISVTLITMSVVYASLSKTGTEISFSRSESLYPEYRSLRTSFLYLLSSGCSRFEQMPTATEVGYVFNSTYQQLSNVELRYGRYLEAELLSVDRYNSTSTPSVYVTFDFSLSSGERTISERITFYVWHEN